MKDIIKTSFKELLTNRSLTTVSGLTVFAALLFVLYIGFAVRPSDLQLVTHYSAYGITHLYRSQWFYLWSFALFGVVVAVAHVSLAIKLYISKGHPLAVMLAWLGFAIIVFAWLTAYAIIHVWSPV